MPLVVWVKRTSQVWLEVVFRQIVHPSWPCPPAEPEPVNDRHELLKYRVIVLVCLGGVVGPCSGGLGTRNRPEQEAVQIQEDEQSAEKLRKRF